MKIIYATDLHGVKEKFTKVLDLAKETQADIIHIGADILPKHPSGYIDIEIQSNFIKGFLKQWWQECKKLKKRYL